MTGYNKNAVLGTKRVIRANLYSVPESGYNKNCNREFLINILGICIRMLLLDIDNRLGSCYMRIWVWGYSIPS